MYIAFAERSCGVHDADSSPCLTPLTMPRSVSSAPVASDASHVVYDVPSRENENRITNSSMIIATESAAPFFYLSRHVPALRY